MSNALVSFFFAAGVGSFVYTRMGKRIGYGNSQNVWTVVGVSVFIAFLFFYTLARFVIHLH